MTAAFCVVPFLGKTVPKHLEAGKPKLALAVPLEEWGGLLSHSRLSVPVRPDASPRGLLHGAPAHREEPAAAGSIAQRLQRGESVGRARLCWGPRAQRSLSSPLPDRGRNLRIAGTSDLGRMSVSQEPSQPCAEPRWPIAAELSASHTDELWWE